MKKAPLFITIGIVAFSVAGYFLYQKFVHQKNITPWDMVPQSAVAVYETSACGECIEPVKTSSLWELLRLATLHNKKRDSVINMVGFLTQPKNGSMVSLHVTKKDDFDFVFYIPLKDPNDKKIFEVTAEGWKKKQGIRVTEREYNTIKIQELITSGSSFSWAMLEDVWVGSFTPFLVEDVIRVKAKGKEGTFKDAVSDVYQMPKLKNDAGNLYIHLKNFADWLVVFAPDFNLDMIHHFGQATVLDIKADDKNLTLNGFSLEDPTDKSVLSVFNNQDPTPFHMKQYVSNRTVMLAVYGISNGSDFGEGLIQYPKRKAILNDTLKLLSSSLNVNLMDLYKTINNEVALCYVESAGTKMSKLLMIETENAEAWIDPLNKMAEQLSEDTVFFERYSGYEIRKLPVFRFPEKIFSPFVNGFDQSFYTSLGNTIILGENIEHLKSFLEDIDREDTWGKSVAQNKFLESTLLESNISLYINTPRIWNILSGSLNEKWSGFMKDKRSLLASIGMGAFQFSHLNKSFYTNISWTYKQSVADVEKEDRTDIIVAGFRQGISSKPFVVRNHVDKTDEVFLQDSSHHIHLISSKGSVLWSLPLNGEIIGDVFQVDYYRNGKLQYFFATETAIHIIDRLGNYIQPFPVSLKGRSVEYVSLIDYDHSKNYRFLIADRSGKLWMYDKEGKNLEGWNSRNVEDGLFTAARHHRINGRDYIIAIRKDGKVFLMNRRGELLKGFPLTLDARPSGDYFLELGSRQDNTYFVVVSRDGFRIKFNLEGTIHTRETLLKNSIDARFSLIKEKSSKSYCIVRQEPKGLTVLDVNTKEIISNEYIGINPTQIQHFDFGAGRVYYLLSDMPQELTYLYGNQGSLITTTPLSGHYSSLQPQNSDKVSIYLTYQKSLIIRSLF